MNRWRSLKWTCHFINELTYWVETPLGRPRRLRVDTQPESSVGLHSAVDSSARSLRTQEIILRPHPCQDPTCTTECGY